MLPNITILLGITVNNDQLVLRLDQDGMAQFEPDQPAISELVLTRWNGPEIALEILRSGIEKQFDYEFDSLGSGFTVSLFSDYETNEVELTCDSINEIVAEYTLEDWQKKSRRLAQWYSFAYKRAEENLSQYEMFSSQSRKRIMDEIDRCQRKIEFLKETNSQKAEQMRSQVEAYQRALTIMELLMPESNAS
jgi:hypothetical protein